MMNDKKNIVNDDTTMSMFISLFSVLLFIGIICFCVFAYFKWIKGQNLFKKDLKINILIIEIIKW